MNIHLAQKIFGILWILIFIVMPATIPSSYSWHSYGLFFPVFFVDEIAEATNSTTEDMWWGAIFLQCVWLFTWFISFLILPHLSNGWDQILGTIFGSGK